MWTPLLNIADVLIWESPNGLLLIAVVITLRSGTTRASGGKPFFITTICCHGTLFRSEWIKYVYNSRPLNGIVKPSCSLTVQLAIGSLVLRDQRVCAPVLCCSAPHIGEVQKFNDGLEIGRQVIVEFYEFCWVHEASTNIIRLIQQLDVRLVNYVTCYSGE